MRTLRILPLFVLLLTLAACDSATGDDVAGTYRATRFQADTDDDARTPMVDVLSLGASLTMTLRDDESVSGVLTLPESLVDDDNQAVTPFGGTYTVSGSTVRFTQEADLFIRDATWTYVDGRLSTEEFGISVVLEK